MGTVILEIGNFYLESVGLFESFLKNFFRVFIQCGASQMAQRLKDLPAMWEAWVRSLGQEDPWRRKWQPTPVFWPREFHGLYSPWDRKESDTTEQLSLSILRFKEIDTYSQNILVKTQNTKEEILKWSWKCHIKKRTGKTKLTIRLTADFSRATTATSGQWNNTFKVLGENYCQPRLNLEKEMATHSSILA